MEKVVYALILASRKLRPYFQAHKIEVRSSYPLGHVLHKPEFSGRMLKWVVELGQFDIEYKPRSSIKGQALADFILEFPLEQEKDTATREPVNRDHIQGSDEQTPLVWWTMNIYGAVNKEGVSACIVLISPEGHHLCSAIHF